MSIRDAIAWIRDEIRPEGRQWEEFYRNRWTHDKVVRSTHGVNCTGGCTWNIHVKDGIVTWEMQGLDYPLLEDGIPPYEPRGCQRGISFSWYLYSPLRVKYPYIRGALLDLWREARANHADPVECLEEPGRETLKSVAAGNRHAAKEGCGGRTGPQRWKSSPRRWCRRSRSMGRIASPVFLRFLRCRWSATPLARD